MIRDPCPDHPWKEQSSEEEPPVPEEEDPTPYEEHTPESAESPESEEPDPEPYQPEPEPEPYKVEDNDYADTSPVKYYVKQPHIEVVEGPKPYQTPKPYGSRHRRL